MVMKRQTVRLSRAFASVALVCIAMAHAAPAEVLEFTRDITRGGTTISMDFVAIRNAGNAPDTTTYGAVNYAYDLGKYNVTNAQYVQFLAAVASQTDTHGLYNESMASQGNPDYGGIVRGGSEGSWVYSAVSGLENRPVNWISFYDAARFVNWLTTGGTEDGVYKFSGGTLQSTMDHQQARNQYGVAYFLPNENEWYKAAYFDPDRNGPGSPGYWLYPTGGDTIAATHANYGASGYSRPTAVGTNEVSTHRPSAYGAYDMGGNLWEMTETRSGSNHVMRGACFVNAATLLASTHRNNFDPVLESRARGFRVASIPEPGSGLLLLAGAACLSLRRRRRRT